MKNIVSATELGPKSVPQLLEIQYIGLATKMSFCFFPLEDFSRSKSFFFIENFRPYVVFDSWHFIDYSEKKSFKFCCLFIVLHWFEMVITDGHFSHILLYYFQKGNNTVQARKKLYVFGEKALTEHQCQNWFARFVPEISTSKMHHALDAQLKFQLLRKWSRKTGRRWNRLGAKTFPGSNLRSWTSGIGS